MKPRSVKYFRKKSWRIGFQPRVRVIRICDGKPLDLEFFRDMFENCEKQPLNHYVVEIDHEQPVSQKPIFFRIEKKNLGIDLEKS